MVKYYYDIDYNIIYALYKYGTLSYRKLKWIIESGEFLNRGIAPETFDHHIKRMREAHYITSENEKRWKRGQRLFLCLTYQTYQEIKLDSLKISYNYDYETLEQKVESGSLSYSKLKKIQKNIVESPQERRRKAYYLMICINSLKSPLSYKDDNYCLYPGVSVTDVLGAYSGGNAFSHIDLDREIIGESFRFLRREKIVKEIRIDGKEVRYDIIEPSLKEFVKDCLNLFNTAIMFRFHIIWQGVRPPSAEERQYYELHWGEKVTNQRFRRVYQILHTNKQNKTHNINETKYHVECLDNNICEYIEKLRNKYEVIIKKYPSLCQTLMEVIYPKFLQREVEKAFKKKIKKDGSWVRKSYPKLQMLFSRDILEYTDGGD